MDSHGNRRQMTAGGKPKEYFSHAREELLMLVPQSAGTILDVGCGGGALGLNLQRMRAGVTIDGIEMVREVAPMKSYRKVYLGNVERVMPILSKRKRRYDCIIFADVLEHLLDPWRVVASSRNLLSKGGCIVASVPNIRNYSILYRLFLKGEWTYTREGLLDWTHLRFFTLASIKAMFESNGFEINQVKSIRYPPTRGINKLVHAIISRSKRLSDLDVFQYLIVARRSNAKGT